MSDYRAAYHAASSTESAQETAFDPRDSWPAPPDEAAFHGLAGEIVRAIEPHSEADPAALLVQLLVAVGNAVGRPAYFLAEADRHYPNLFAVLIGDTSKGRKGTSWGQIRRLVAAAESTWINRVLSGLSSGEGVIYNVRDPSYKREPVKKGGRVTEYEEVEADPGVADKRLLAYQPEFASVLRIATRDGNTLSAILRDAWDRGDLATLTKNSPTRATGAHVSIIGHVTTDELRAELARTDAANGFGNRFLWLCVRRSKYLPEGGSLREADIAPLIERLASVIQTASRRGEMRRDAGARALWHSIYAQLSDGRPGLLGAILGRAEAQVMRLALIYALLDESEVISEAHLRAALAVWAYCERSTQVVFGDTLGDPLADDLLGLLRAAGDSGLTRTELRDQTGRHKNGDAIGRALGVLHRAQLARLEREPTDGRPAERWYATRQASTDEASVASVASVAMRHPPEAGARTAATTRPPARPTQPDSSSGNGPVGMLVERFEAVELPSDTRSDPSLCSGCAGALSGAAFMTSAGAFCSSDCVALRANAAMCAYPSHVGREWRLRGGGPLRCGVCHPPPAGIDLERGTSE